MHNTFIFKLGISFVDSQRPLYGCFIVTLKKKELLVRFARRCRKICNNIVIHFINIVLVNGLVEKLIIIFGFVVVFVRLDKGIVGVRTFSHYLY